MFEKYPNKKLTMQIYVDFDCSMSSSIVCNFVADKNVISTLNDYMSKLEKIKSISKIVLQGRYEGATGKAIDVCA